MITSNRPRTFDLKERIFRFVISVLSYLNKLPRSQINKVIFNQCARAATSIGANYEEADVAHTRKDFTYKMEIVRKEAKETNYWLRISNEVNFQKTSNDYMLLTDECLQLVKIFSTIITKSKKN